MRFCGKTRFRFNYSASDPGGVQKTTDAAGSDLYTPAPGGLRIWTKDGGQYRKKAEVDHYLTIEDQRVQDGDFIASNHVYWATNIMHGTMNTTLYLEGITPGTYDITVQVDPEGLNEWPLNDRVVVTVISGGIIPDFNHDRKIDETDRALIKTKGPFRFWINDDTDVGDIAAGDSDLPGSSTPNCGNDHVDGRSDLIDFFPVWLDIKQVLNLYPSAVVTMNHPASAVNIVYTDLDKDTAGNYLTTEANTYGTNRNQYAHEAATLLAKDRVTIPSGVEYFQLDPDFVARIRNGNGKGILLIEARQATDQPLTLQIRDAGWSVLHEFELKLSFRSVEQMYRWINLRAVTGGEESRQTDTNQPINYPDAICNGKHFVFVHGYNVNETAARAWGSEMFKRLYQAGSRAMFSMVTWHGNISQVETPVATFDVNYWLDVVNAFQTAPALNNAVASLPGIKAIAGHSLGNMLVSSAVSDLEMPVAHYFMLDAAVPVEAYDETALSETLMEHPDWHSKNYASRLWASKWHELFPVSDGRSRLAWTNRFGPLSVAHNFYSSTEDVLENNDGTLPGPATTRRAWANQELRKGSWLDTPGTGNGWGGGWGFNHGYDVCVETESGTVCWLLPHAEADLLPAEQLQTNSFFRLLNSPLNIYTPMGDELARDNEIRDQLLATSIPALSLAAGRNPIEGLAGSDMMVFRRGSYPAGWPRPQNDWQHSDVRNIAFPYVYGLFDTLVDLGGLQ